MTPESRIAVVGLLTCAMAACHSPSRATRGASPFVRGTPLAPPIPATLTDAMPAGPTPPASEPARAQAHTTEVFPGIRLDAAGHTVEFDAALSPMLVPDPRAPLFFLEVIACTPDTREHETLVVTKVKPSNLHAAMLAAGFHSGRPGGWTFDNGQLTPRDPSGDAVEIRFRCTDPAEPSRTREVDPLDWIQSAATGAPIAQAMHSRALADGRPGAAWVFAGSIFVEPRPASPSGEVAKPVYHADESGTVIGLTTFGSEVIGLARTISPDAGIEEPEWVARMEALPPAGTPITVVLRPATADRQSPPGAPDRNRPPR